MINGIEISSGTAVFISETTTLKVKAFKEGWEPSRTKTALYTITGTVPAPVFDPPEGTYEPSGTVRISCSGTT